MSFPPYQLITKSLFADRSQPHSLKLSQATALQLYLCAVAGLSLGMGIVYAGTGDLRARDTILGQLTFLQK